MDAEKRKKKQLLFVSELARTFKIDKKKLEPREVPRFLPGV